MSVMLFLPEPGMSWLIVIAIIALLFGGSKLPQLAKALGQSKKAFKDGLAEGEEEAAKEKARREVADSQKASLSSVDDEELFEEARRRARLRVAEGSIPEDRK
ncbi:MAG TPA: twin-arginine translocase TatA/TatE family subunit [Pyrinomonadaceae bacterium]|nr:twin-arginine translocase TatA/TatE family subunit [Pyrinomonadaceae bacterium]